MSHCEYPPLNWHQVGCWSRIFVCTLRVSSLFLVLAVKDIGIIIKTALNSYCLDFVSCLEVLDLANHEVSVKFAAETHELCSANKPQVVIKMAIWTAITCWWAHVSLTLNYGSSGSWSQGWNRDDRSESRVSVCVCEVWGCDSVGVSVCVPKGRIKIWLSELRLLGGQIKKHLHVKSICDFINLHLHLRRDSASPLLRLLACILASPAPQVVELKA